MAFKNGKTKHRMRARKSSNHLMKSKQTKHFLPPIITPGKVAHKGFLLKLISPILCLCRTFSKVFLVPRWLSTPLSVEKIDILEQRISYLEKEVNLLKNQNQLLSISTSILSQPATSLSSLSLPPPPPPPPPLPMFLLPSQNSAGNNIKNSVTNTLEHKNTLESRIITDELLKDIKLRKVFQTNDKCTTDEEKKVQLVTVQDIKNVKLKKTVRKRTPHRTPPLNIASTLSALRARNVNIKKSSGNKKSPGNIIRRHLRKVPVKRSPGGTPMVLKDFSHSTGDGLTPMLSNALKDKFKKANENAQSNPCTPNVTLKFDCEVT